MSGLGSKLLPGFSTESDLLTPRSDALGGVGDTVGKTTEGVTNTVGGVGKLLLFLNAAFVFI